MTRYYNKLMQIAGAEKLQRLLTHPQMVQYFLFVLVGFIGFVVDSSVLLVVVTYLPLDLYEGRVFSYLAAATCTWYLNRRYTFHSTAKVNHTARKQWITFVATNIFVALINYAVYAHLISTYEEFERLPVLAVAVGAGCSMVFSFLLSRFIIFR